MLLVDSDTWIFYLDASLPEHGRVGSRLRPLLDATDVLLTTVVQVEVAHYIVRRMGPTGDEALRLFFDYPAEIASLGPEDVGPAVDLLRRFAADGLGGRDATLLHAARSHDVSLICSSDKALGRAARKLGFEVRDLAAR